MRLFEYCRMAVGKLLFCTVALCIINLWIFSYILQYSRKYYHFPLSLLIFGGLKCAILLSLFWHCLLDWLSFVRLICEVFLMLIFYDVQLGIKACWIYLLFCLQTGVSRSARTTQPEPSSAFLQIWLILIYQLIIVTTLMWCLTK